MRRRSCLDRPRLLDQSEERRIHAGRAIRGIVQRALPPYRFPSSEVLARASRLRKNLMLHLILAGAALQCVRENRLVFWGKMRQVRRYVTFSALQSGSSVLAAAQRERRVGRRSPEYFPAPRGGAVGYDRVRERVQR